MSSWQAEVDITNKVVVATTDPRHRKAEADIIDSNNKQPRDVEDIINELDATSVTTWLDPRMFNFAFSMFLDSTIDEKPFRSSLSLIGEQDSASFTHAKSVQHQKFLVSLVTI
jgi:hypothetical protein